MDVSEQKRKMNASATYRPGQCSDVQTASEALNLLGLNGPSDEAAVRNAFRKRVLQASPALHDGSDQGLRRLIAARDLLLQSGPRTAQPCAQVDALPLKLNLDQALHGGLVRIQAPALEFGATNITSLMQVMDVNLLLPKGLRDDVDVYVPSLQGGRILCHTRIESEDHVRVWGDDIWMTAWLETQTLRFGGDVVIETPHGPQNLHLQHGIMDGSSLRLPGLGLPATASAPAGDLIVRLCARPVQTTPSAFRQRWAS